MAIVNKNLVTQGLSGALGRTLVFRRVGNRTIVSTIPSTTKEPSAAQLTQREKFQQAILYAKAQMADAVVKEEYKHAAKNLDVPNAYNIAVADFFNAPDITEVDLSGYTGKVNDKIRVRVTDDFKVKSVYVEIRDAGGVVQEGAFAAVQANGLDWLFTAKVSNASLAGDKITIKATDLPGNETLQEQAI